MELTKDTDKFLCIVYKEYLSRRKGGIRKSQAINFDDPTSLVDQLLLDETPDDIADSISELAKAGFVETYIDSSFHLNNKSIIYMENRFKNGLLEVADFISKFIP